MDGKPANIVGNGNCSLKSPYVRADVKGRLSKHASRRIARYGDHPRLRNPGTCRSGDFVTASVCFPSALRPGHRIAQAPLPRCMVKEVVNESLSRHESDARAPPARKRRGGRGARRRRRRRRQLARKRRPPVEAVVVIPPKEPSGRKKKLLERGVGRRNDTRGERTVQLLSARTYRKVCKYIRCDRRRWDLSVIKGVFTKTRGPRRSRPSISPRPPEAPRPVRLWPWPVAEPSLLGKQSVVSKQGRPDLQWRKCKPCGTAYQGQRKGLCDRCFAKGKRK